MRDTEEILARTWSQGSLGTLSPGQQGQGGRREAQVMHVVSSAWGVGHTSGSQRDSVSMKEEKRGEELSLKKQLFTSSELGGKMAPLLFLQLEVEWLS